MGKELKILEVENQLLWERLQDFLVHFLNQQDPGLLIIEDDCFQAVCRKLQEALQFEAVTSAQEFHEALRSKGNILITFESTPEPALISDIKQCAARAGALETRDQHTLDSVSVYYDTSATQILVVVPHSGFSRIQEQSELTHYLGLIEYL